ncbi:MAG: hypothetical protein O3A00_22590 [Planctomycetota bacterium]|nr:hypothetical protein [Planctomycetota bacterium]
MHEASSFCKLDSPLSTVGCWRIVTTALLLAATSTTGCQTSPLNFTGTGCLECQSKQNKEEWWAEKASLPVGARQRYEKGKMWPPFPRPTGEEQQMSHVFHANHYWPYPYKCDDRRYVRDIMESHAASGWVEATTLYDYHFEEDSNELTHTGRNHLYWILKHVPAQRQMTFIEQLPDAQMNQERMENVKLAAADLMGEEHVPAIMLRLTSPYGRPASEVDAMRRKEIATLRSPRISYGGDTGSAEIAKTGASQQ